MNPSDLVGVPMIFRATEVFAAATEALAHVPCRGLMRLLARHALLLIFSHWMALPPAQAHRQAGPEWRQCGSSQTPGPRLGCRGASPSIRRRGGHQTPPDPAASAHEPRRRSDLARAYRSSRCAGAHRRPSQVHARARAKRLGTTMTGSDRLVKRGAPLEGRGVSRAARGAPVAPSPQVREAGKAYLDHLHVPFDVKDAQALPSGGM